MKYVNGQLKSRPMVVLEALLGVARKYKKNYCWVSQDRLCNLVGEFGGIWISKRSLNRDLRFLEQDGWIERVRRHKRGADGRILFASTLYKFRGKVFNMLYSLGNSVKKAFGHFRLPSWVKYQLSQKQVLSPLPGSSVENLWNSTEKGLASPSKAFL